MLIGAKTYQAFRTSGGAYVEGEWTPGAGSAFDVILAVQPEDDGKRSDLFPEGWQTRHVRKAYSEDLENVLHAVNQEGPESADTVEIDGILFQVQEREDWTQAGGPLAHYRYVMVELDDEGNGGP